MKEYQRATLKYTPKEIYTLGHMKRYLSVTEVAERTGLARNTVKSYSQIPGRLPTPDAVIGRVKGWLPQTIDAWLTRRRHD